MSENFKIEGSSIYEIVTESLETCEICWKGSDSCKLFQSECGHSICSICFSEYYSHCISTFQIFPFRCPAEGCGTDIPESASHFLEEEAFFRFEALRQKHKHLKNPKVRWCPTINCDGFGLLPEDSSKIACNSCLVEISSTQNDQRSEIFKTFSIAECPGCGCFIEKKFGCMKTRCYCGTEFCMKCGKLESINHSYWNCIACDAKGEVSVWVLLLTIFSQVLVPLYPVLLVFIYRNNWDKNYWGVINEHPWFYAVVIFMFSPMILVFSLFYLPFVWGWMCLDCLFDDPKARNKYFWLIKAVLYLPVVLLSFVGLLLGLGLVSSLAPLYGLWLLGHSLFTPQKTP